MKTITSASGAETTLSEFATAPAPWQLLAAFLLAVAGYLALYHGHLQPFLLSDAHVYATALDVWMHGGDPYGADHFGALRFVYPPIVLFAGAPLARLFPANSGWPIYLAISFASAFALPVVMARYYFQQQWLNPFFALLIFFAAVIGIEAAPIDNREKIELLGYRMFDRFWKFRPLPPPENSSDLPPPN